MIHAKKAVDVTVGTCRLLMSNNNHSTNYYINQLRKFAHAKSQSRFFFLALPGSTCFPLLVEKKRYIFGSDKCRVASWCSFLIAEAAEKSLVMDALVFGAHFGLIRTVKLVQLLGGLEAITTTNGRAASCPANRQKKISALSLQCA